MTHFMMFIAYDIIEMSLKLSVGSRSEGSRWIKNSAADGFTNI